MIVSWNVAIPKKRNLWETVVAAYEREKNRKAVAAAIALSQKQLDKMMRGTEGRQLAVARFEGYLDALDPDGRSMVMDYLDWKYRLPREQKQESISGRVKHLMDEVHRLLDLQEGAEKR